MKLIGKYSIKSLVLLALAIFFTSLITISLFTSYGSIRREGMTTDASGTDPNPTDASGAISAMVKHMDASASAAAATDAILKHLDASASAPEISNSVATATVPVKDFTASVAETVK